MKRILPFRDYNEHNVVNLFALDTANNSLSTSGNGDAGVIVKVTDGAISYDAVEYVTSAYLGKVDYPNVGRNGYPEVPLKVGVATSGDAALGITLFETAMYDENGEKLLYYRQKALENQAVLSGQAVPVLTKGTVMLEDGAFDGSIPAPATALYVGNGKFTSTATGSIVGRVLATGSRVAGAEADYFAGSAGSTGTYALITIDF